MRLHALRTVSAALVVALCFASPALAAGPDFSWIATLAPGKTISIHGISGKIEATRAAGRQASVTAIKSGKSSQIDRVRIEATPSAEGITICALYPGKHGHPMTCDAERGIVGGETEDVDVDVDFTVEVPEGVRLEANTVNGSVEASDLASDVSASTVNGEVRVTTTGIAECRTVNGSINASMGKGSWDHPIKMRTVNGSVHLQLPHEVNADITASCVNGGISSDFPVYVEGSFLGKSGKIEGTIGKGGKELSIQTVNGSIIISRVGAADDTGAKKSKI